MAAKVNEMRIHQILNAAGFGKRKGPGVATVGYKRMGSEILARCCPDGGNFSTVLSGENLDKAAEMAGIRLCYNCKAVWSTRNPNAHPGWQECWECGAL